MALSGTKQIFFYLLLGAVVIIFLGLVVQFSPQLESRFRKEEKPHLVINNQQVFVEVATSAEERAQGLSNRQSLGQDEGLLFIFPEVGHYSFWMKEMNFNLDFVFIRDEEVVFLVEDVPYPQAGEEPARVKSEVEFNQVLEVNQGMIEKLRVKIGDKVESVL